MGISTLFYSKKLFLLFLFIGLTTFSVSGQTCPGPDPLDILNPIVHEPDCFITSGDCTSKDLELVSAFLDIGDTCNSCDEGETITAELFLSINNTTGSTRTSFAIFGNLEVVAPDGTSVLCPISRCNGEIPPNQITTLSYGSITFTCGEELTLKDMVLSWTDAAPNSTCGNHDCKEIAPKCGTVDEIVITPPLNAIASAECDSNNEANIDLVVKGGTSPFNFSWLGPNGFSSTSEDLSNVAQGESYTVVITDGEGCTTTTTVVAPICFTCPTLTNESVDFGTCIDDQGQTLSVDTDIDTINIEFVWFASAQSDPYIGGTEIGTAVAPTGGTATSNTGINFATAGTYYVYAILDTDDPELTDPNCRPFSEILITIEAAVTPLFDAVEICSDEMVVLADLPTSSTNGISGTWAEANDVFTFTPDAAECATTATLTVNVTDAVTPLFDAVEICSDESIDVSSLPLTSTNGITGTWSEAAGVYTFSPADAECATTATLTVNVTDAVTPLFDAVEICSDESIDVSSLPLTSTNGITGTWSEAAGVYTFSPADAECATTATLTVNVTDAVTPLFGAVEICSDESIDVSSLPLTSTNGITGTWSEAAGVYTFSPADVECATTTTLTVTIVEAPSAGADGTTAVCESTIVDVSDFVTVSGGTFTNPSGQGILTGSNFDTTGLTPGDYRITYTVSSANCGSDEAVVTITVAEDIIVKTCEAIPATYCGDSNIRYDFYWFGSNASPGGSNFFGSNTSNLSFTEFNDGTALIQGTTSLGSCTAELYIKLIGKTDWAGWQLQDGTFKEMGCTSPDPTTLNYYVIDNSVSTITTTGGDCLEEGSFIVSQKPDPNDPTTPHLGVIVGQGGMLHGLDSSADGIAGWGFMGTENNPKKYEIDFNFELNCSDATGCDFDEEICDGIDNNGDGQIDEGFDSDNDGTPDCADIEECDGLDNDGDLLVDEGFDSDMDGISDCNDEEECDGLDNDGDGYIDEGLSCGNIEICDGIDNDGDDQIDEGFDDTDNDGIADCLDSCDDRFDADNDGTPDCTDVEECDGLDNDGDGSVDEGFSDTDNDGTADCVDQEECDGLDNDGDGDIDEGFADTDGDGIADCVDQEECDGVDNNGDGQIDEGFADTDGDGIADCVDQEECDGLDNNGDGQIDEGFDSDNDGTPDCDDMEECDGIDNNGDGQIDEGLNCTEICDGMDNNGDGQIDEGLDCAEICDGMDNNGDGQIDEGLDCTEICDGMDNNGDGQIDEGLDCTEICDGIDNNGDGQIDEGLDCTEICDGMDNNGDGQIDEGLDCTEICDGIDNNGDGQIDESFDSDNDGTPDCDDVEECDGLDNNGDGQIDEGLECDAPISGCETAFARFDDGFEGGNTCFIDDGFNRWGWTNYFAVEGDYILDLYSGAGQCDLSKGEKSGNVQVAYDGEEVLVTIELLNGFVMTEAQLYIGGVPYPVKGNKETVAPGQYPFNSGELDSNTTYSFDPVDVSHINGGIYVIVHAVTCKKSEDAGKVLKTAVTAYPMTFKNDLNLRVDIPYDAQLEVEIFDVNGKCVIAKKGMNVNAGSNNVHLDVSNLSPDMYFLILRTGKEKIVKKILSIK